MNRIPADAPVVTAPQMRAAEEAAFAAGVAQHELMERAGSAVAREALRFAMGRPVLVLAGPGNNGGDAYVAARRLRESGLDVQVAALGGACEGAAAAMRQQWQGETVALADAAPRQVLVDGLFGTGIARPLEAPVVRALERLCGGADFVIAIDVPSGFASDSGDALGSPLTAQRTVALGALKPVHLLAPGAQACGSVCLADLGIPVPTQWRSLARPKIAPLPADTHKYSRGLVVVLEGAMPGAARLAARAALSAGAGYTILAGSDVSGGDPDALVRRPIGDARELTGLIGDERIGALVLGPGLGRDAAAAAWLDQALASRCPLVLDGDALTLLGGEAAQRLAGRPQPTWLTPHAGEFDRMFGGEGSKIERTRAAAVATGATIVHKGPGTVVAAPDGAAIIAAYAPVWLSTAGTGDVLAGALAARVARGSSNAAAEAVWLHGRAAQLAGPAFIADGLIDLLPAAIAECL